MATNQSSFTLTKREKRDIKRLASIARLWFSNYVRQRLGLGPLIHGGARFKRKKAAELNGGTK